MDNQVEPTTPYSPVLFEEDYIFKSNRSITSTPDIAITELIANAWDAGAFNVKLYFPEEKGDTISIEDDGVGMSDDEFTQMWMTLNYDRLKRQGKTVTFPPDVIPYKRLAYGRNGIGRHGMFCFADYYTVETWQNGTCYKYDIALSSGNHPYKITKKTYYDKQGHGTKISTYVHRHHMNADDLADIVSARFLYDPRFIVEINGKSIDLANHKGLFDKRQIQLKNGINLVLTIIDSSKTAQKSQQHGIAFWVGGRLVGNPSWTHGNLQYLDGRYKIAKKYTLIIQTDDLMEDVLPDWTGFIDTPSMRSVFLQLKEHVDLFISEVMSDHVGELQQDIIRETLDDLETLTPSGRREVSAFIETITSRSPTINPEFLQSAVEAVIKIEQAKKGTQLLNQLCLMSSDEIDRLSDLLKEWDIDDILSVITELDKRMAVVEAIDRIYNNKKTDELHTLHPLILNARWLFGPEFDSPMFVSNSALTSVVKKLFRKKEYDLTEITNPRKRPDIVCLKKSTLRAVCTDRPDYEADGIMKPDQVLLIEIKRGGSVIQPREVSQVEDYVRQIRKSANLHRTATITAYVVGAAIGDVDCNKTNDSGKVHVVTYGLLIETANTKLFRLRAQLTEHYNEIGNDSLVEKALKEPKQLLLT